MAAAAARHAGDRARRSPRASPPRCGSASGAGTCGSTTASTCCCPRTTRPAPGTASPRSSAATSCSQRDVQTVDLRLPDRLVRASLTAAEPAEAAPSQSRRRARQAGRRSRHDGNARAIRPAARQPDRRASISARPRSAASSPGSTAASRASSASATRCRAACSNGAIVDLDAAEPFDPRPPSTPPRRWPARRSSEVVVNLSGGFAASRIVKAEIGVGGREISDARHAPRARARLRACASRPTAQVIHSIPVGFSIDDSRGIRDPRGMFGAAARRQHAHRHRRARRRCATSRAAIGRCASRDRRRWSSAPTPPGLACLVEDEMRPRRHRHRHGRRHDHDRRVLRRQPGLRRLRAGRRRPRHQRHRPRPVDAARPCRAHEDAVRQRHRLDRSTSAR